MTQRGIPRLTFCGRLSQKVGSLKILHKMKMSPLVKCGCKFGSHSEYLILKVQVFKTEKNIECRTLVGLNTLDKGYETIPGREALDVMAEAKDSENS